jgi:hypothetical protein
VLIPDDKQFEKYLKQFQPVAPEPLMVKQPARTRRPLVVAAWAAVAAILPALIVSVVLHRNTQPARDAGPGRPAVAESISSQPLTIASANAQLARAPSFKAAVESMAFQQESKPVSEGRYSLLALLSKEEVKP